MHRVGYSVSNLPSLGSWSLIFFGEHQRSFNSPCDFLDRKALVFVDEYLPRYLLWYLDYTFYHIIVSYKLEQSPFQRSHATHSFMITLTYY